MKSIVDVLGVSMLEWKDPAGRNKSEQIIRKTKEGRERDQDRSE